jgi:hypothetical protein
MCISLEPERLDGFGSYSEFNNSSVISIFTVNTIFLAAKLRALEMDPTTQKWRFSRKRLQRILLEFR